MSDRNRKAVEDEATNTAVADEGAREFSDRIRAFVKWHAKDLSRQEAADTAIRMIRDLAGGAIENADAQREVLDAFMKRAVQIGQLEPEPDEIEVRMLLDSFDGRIAEIEQRMDRVLAHLDVG